MARDYKNRSQARRREPPPPRPGRPPWVWMLSGLVMGLIVAVGAYMEGRNPGTILAINHELLATIDDGVIAAPEDASKPARPKPVFAFYHLLPEAEVEVDDEPAPRRQPHPPKVQKPKPASVQTASRVPGQNTAPSAVALSQPGDGTVVGGKDEAGVKAYMLQVGSFRALSDADRLRATLTLGGHEALIQTVSVNGSDTWHRVRLGPFGDLNQANRARDALARDQVNSMMLRIRS
jgi:cell division protein FtsN